jgi:formylglycine-generating enzyme required for sulfatase activity
MIFVPDGETAAFYIDKNDVTNAEYKEFCDATGRPLPNKDYFVSSPTAPVLGVTIVDAAEFAAWKEKRLPTETEWRKAAAQTEAPAQFPWREGEPMSAAGFRCAIFADDPRIKGQIK